MDSIEKLQSKRGFPIQRKNNCIGLNAVTKQVKKKLQEEIASLQTDLRKAKADKRIETEESLKLRRTISWARGG